MPGAGRIHGGLRGRSPVVDMSHRGEGAGAATAARYGIRFAGHDIEVRLPGDRIALDAATVLLDGEPVDPARLTVRSRDVGLETADGVEIRLHLAGRANDVLSRVRLRRPDGYWVDLEPRGR